MREELLKLVEELGIDIDSDIKTVDISIFCSSVSDKQLTECEQSDIIKM